MALAQVAWPCEDVAVLSTSGKYMLLDGDTLEALDVGDLRWAGVWRIASVVAGSTPRRLAFVADQFTGDAMYRSDGGRGRASALVAVANLAEAGGAAMEMAFSREYDFGYGHAQWIDDADELVVWQRERSVLSVLDERLERVDEWSLSSDARTMAACRRDGRLFVGGDDFRVVRRGGASVVDRLARPEGFDDCRMEHPSSGCLASVGCRGDGRYEKVVVDLVANRVVSSLRFAEPARKDFYPGDTRLVSETPSGQQTYMKSVALFAGGRRLLRQQWIATPDPPGANDSYSVRPATLLRVLDTAGDGVLAENDFAPPGNVSRAFCRGDGERVLLTGHGRVRLVDLNTLKPIASVAIPFGAGELPLRHFTLPSAVSR